MMAGQWPEGFILVRGTWASLHELGSYRTSDLLQHVLPWLKLRCHLLIAISDSIDAPGRILPGLSVSQATREIIVHGFFKVEYFIKGLLIRNCSCPANSAQECCVTSVPVPKDTHSNLYTCRRSSPIVGWLPKKEGTRV